MDVGGRKLKEQRERDQRCTYYPKSPGPKLVSWETVVAKKDRNSMEPLEYWGPGTRWSYRGSRTVDPSRSYLRRLKHLRSQGTSTPCGSSVWTGGVGRGQTYPLY